MALSLKAIWNYDCPKCRKSKMFKEPFEFSKPLDMNDSCPVCKQSFEPEPGFYFGAMFISYIASSFILLIPALILVFYFKWSVEGAMGVVLLIGALIYFKFIRLSRAIWLHLMVGYE